MKRFYNKLAEERSTKYMLYFSLKLDASSFSSLSHLLFRSFQSWRDSSVPFRMMQKIP